jgi:short-subunit dehydrogenase
MPKVAVVTGAARGFGREIARQLTARGYALLITDVDATELERTAAALGDSAHPHAADARSPEDHREVAAAAARLGSLAVWVNNAGIARAGKAWQHSDGAVTQQVEVNLLGAIHGSRAAVEGMGVRGGHILNVASISGLGPVPGLAVYAATKAGVLNFSTSLQGELDLAKLPIRVHALCPDAADTKLVGDVRGIEDSAVLFSGNGLLSPESVADAAVAMLDGRRIVASLPAYRAALARVGALAPRAGWPALALLRRVGERRRRAPGACGPTVG